MNGRRKARILARVEKGVQWWVGDWWAFGQHHYGDRAKACAEGLFGRAFQTIANAASVSRAFETSRRREVLSYSHHAEVAGLSRDEADAILDSAEANGWSKREVRAAVSRLKTATALPAPSEADTCTVADLDALVASGKRFGCIYADPPWRYDNQATRASTGNHYAAGEKNDHTGMSVQQICELPVRELAADDAHLHLWTTNSFLFECPRILEAWGFEFRSSFIWVKPQIGLGNYWRNSHEFLLTAIRGDAKRFNDHSLQSWIECSRGKHSDKPEQIRALIERASAGPFLELFGRRVAPGRAVWGNQIERTMFDAAAVTLFKAAPTVAHPDLYPPTKETAHELPDHLDRAYAIRAMVRHFRATHARRKPSGATHTPGPPVHRSAPVWRDRPTASSLPAGGPQEPSTPTVKGDRQHDYSHQHRQGVPRVQDLRQPGAAPSRP